MFIQIAIGSAVMLASILIAGVSFGIMEWLFLRLRPWLVREPHLPKVLLVLGLASLAILGLITSGVWLWAFTFRALGVFGTLEEAVYSSLVVFSTLGFGDVLLPLEWRLLGGMAAANGLLNFGLLTAIMVEALRQVRLQQWEWRRRKD